MVQIEVKRTEVKLVEAPEWEYNKVAHEPPEDRQSPLPLRSKVEQLTGHQPIKALSTFKHQAVAPLSSSFMHVSPEKEKSGCKYGGQAVLQSKTK
jgi:hypothetical protein